MTESNFTKWLNRALIIFALSGVAMTFVWQEFSFINELHISDETKFVVRKTFRVLLNDLFMLILIAAWFKDQKLNRLAILIQIVDALFLLPMYLYLKLTIEGTTEISIPLLSLLHRLIINPTLMILLIPAVYFQRMSGRR